MHRITEIVGKTFERILNENHKLTTDNKTDVI